MRGIQNQMVMVIGGVLVLVLGVILADVIIDETTTALTNSSIGSFAGAESIGGLIPFIYFTVIILIGVGMMGIGARGMMTVYALPLAVTAFTPFPVTLTLIAVLAIGAMYSWKQYRSFRSQREHQQLAA